jgi:hypothetical protein
MHILKTSLIAGFMAFVPIMANGTEAQDVPSQAEIMVQEANNRIAAGESPEAVEKALRKGLTDHGMETKKAPPDWDVFARSRWENMGATEQDKTSRGPVAATDGPPSFVMSMGHASD